MSRIDQLISQYCPEGVPMVRLGEVATYTRGVSYNKGQESQTSIGAIPILRANNITLQKNSINFEDVKYIKKDVRVKPEQYLKKNDIFICAGSGSKEHVGKVAFVEKDLNYCFGGFMAVIRTKVEILPRFLYHNFIGSRFNEYLIDSLNSTTINNLNSTIINNYQIPLPPLPVQEEIVRILDAMSDLVTNLDAEISARQKQYEHAREKLLTFGEEVERKTLGEVTTGAISRIDASLLNATNYVGVENLLQNKAGKTLSTSVPSSGLWPMFMPDDVLIGNIRPYLKKIWIADISGGTNGDVLVYRVIEKNILYPKFLNVVLASDDFFNYAMQYAKGAKMPRGSKEDNKAYPIPLPPLSVQQSIVERLDKMESLIQNLRAERALRQKQYEYYREKLLTFERT